MTDTCPVCGQELADDTEAWLHFHEAHGAGQPPARPTGPGQGAPPGQDEPPGGAPSRTPPAGSGGIWRQGYANAPATMVVIAITIGVYAFHYLLQKTTGINSDLSLGGNGKLGTDGQWWRLITPVVVHFGVIHIAFNMAWVYQLGPPIERLLGKVGFVLTYLGTAVAGDVCSDLVYWHRNVLSGGASGAVYGLGGVLIGAWGMAKILDRAREGPPRPGSLQFNDQAVRSLAIFFGVYLVIGGTILPVDTAAHFGGGLLGVVIGAGLAWHHNGPRPRTTTG